MPDISVIIVNWNVRELLLRCLESVMAQTDVRAEVFVVDNASADGSAETVQQRFPNVTVIANKENRGFARANNQAIRLAHGRHLVLLNPDTRLQPMTLVQTVRYLDEHTDVGIVGCKILNTDGTLQPSVRMRPTFASQALVLLKLHAFFPKLPALQQYYAARFDYDQESDVDQVMGAFLAFPSSLLARIGLLDEGFFLWFEEVDFCRRAKRAGYRVRYVPSISIIHAGGESFGQLLSIEQQLIFNRSLLRYFRKHSNALAVCVLALLTPVGVLFAVFEPLIRRWYVPKPVR